MFKKMFFSVAIVALLSAGGVYLNNFIKTVKNNDRVISFFYVENDLILKYENGKTQNVGDIKLISNIKVEDNILIIDYYNGTSESFDLNNNQITQTVSIRINDTHIQWKNSVSDDWIDLITIESLKGVDGKEGTSIIDASINELGNLIIILSDGTSIDAGKLKSINNSNEKINTELISISSVSLNDLGHLIINLSNKELIDVGNVKGENGKSAYDLYLENFPNYIKSEEEWLDDLINGLLKTKNEIYFLDENFNVLKHELVNTNTKLDNLKINGEIVNWYKLNKFTYEKEYLWNFSNSIITDDLLLMYETIEKLPEEIVYNSFNDALVEENIGSSINISNISYYGEHDHGYYVRAMDGSIAYIYGKDLELEPNTLYNMIGVLNSYFGSIQLTDVELEPSLNEFKEDFEIEELNIEDITNLNKEEFLNKFIFTLKNVKLFIKEGFIYIGDSNINDINELSEENSLLLFFAKDMLALKDLEGNVINSIELVFEGYRTDKSSWYISYVLDIKEIS